MFSPKITIIGSGNVAYHLCQAFIKNKVQVKQIWSRNIQKGQELANRMNIDFVSDINLLDTSVDIFIFAVADSAIADIVGRREWNNRILVHTAGSVSIDVFKGFSKNYGVMYPLQSFSAFRILNYAEIPFCVEANYPDNTEMLKKSAAMISSNVYEMNTEQRKYLHLSAVFVSNFVNHLFSIAQKISKEENIPFEIYGPLIKETIAKALESDPVAGQTGPARRNDQVILNNHIKMLQPHPDWQKIYTFVSQSIINMYK